MSLVVLHQGRAVLELEPGPGPLVSVARLPAGVPHPHHPWVHGTSLDGSYEGELREILQAAEGLVDLVGRLRSSGYEVVDR